MTTSVLCRLRVRAAAQDRRLLGAMALVFGLYIVIRIWRSLYVGGGYDSTAIGHVLWRLANGFDSRTALLGGYYLSDHASPILLLFMPVFRWLPEVGMPFVYTCQAFSVLLIGVATADLGRYLNLSAGIVRGLSLSALLSPGAWFATQLDVNETTFGIGPLAMMAVSSIEGRPRAAIMWALVAGSCRIELAGAVLIVGLILWSMRKSGGRAIAAAGLVFLSGYLTWLFINPYPTISIAAHFAHLGTGPSEVVASAIRNPLRVLEPVWNPIVLGTVFFWLLPFGILPVVLEPVWLLAALPTAGVAIFGVWPAADLAINHYWYGFLAVGAIAAPQALARRPWLQGWLPAFLIGSMLGGLVMAAPSASFQFAKNLDASDRGFAREVAGYDADYVAVPESLSGWFIDRPVLVILPRPFSCAESLWGPYTAPDRPPQMIIVHESSGGTLPELAGVLDYYVPVTSNGKFTAWLVVDEEGARRAYVPCSEETLDLGRDIESTEEPLSGVRVG